MKKKYELIKKEPDLKPFKPKSLFKIVNENFDISVEAFRKSFTVMGNKNAIPLHKNDTIFLWGSTEVNTIAEYLNEKYKKLISFQYDREEK
jgi:hypothetical protein